MAVCMRGCWLMVRLVYFYLKGIFMKNVIFTIAALLVGGVAFAGDCQNGVCRQPVRNATRSVVRVAEAVVTAPVRVTKRVVQNTKQRRVARSSCQTCN